MKKDIELRVPREDFAPEHVFACGQTFRYAPREDGWSGIAAGSLVRARHEGGETVLTIHGSGKGEEFWRRYFDLDRDYRGLFPDADPVLRRAAEFASGLRILRQEPFETLISFIVSANNNIPRISGIISRLCREAGDAFEAEGEIHHAFPRPEQLASVSEGRLRKLGCGYRASYLADTAGMAQYTDFSYLAGLETGPLLAFLEEFPGVGPKVARCTALFGFGRLEVFPADVWILRVLKDLYGFEGSAAQADTFAQAAFGEAAGVAQQYLYHYARAHGNSLGSGVGV